MNAPGISVTAASMQIKMFKPMYVQTLVRDEILSSINMKRISQMMRRRIVRPVFIIFSVPYTCTSPCRLCGSNRTIKPGRVCYMITERLEKTQDGSPWRPVRGETATLHTGSPSLEEACSCETPVIQVQMSWWFYEAATLWWRVMWDRQPRHLKRLLFAWKHRRRLPVVATNSPMQGETRSSRHKDSSEKRTSSKSKQRGRPVRSKSRRKAHPLMMPERLVDILTVSQVPQTALQCIGGVWGYFMLAIRIGPIRLWRSTRLLVQKQRKISQKLVLWSGVRQLE